MFKDNNTLIIYAIVVVALLCFIIAVINKIKHWQIVHDIEKKKKLNREKASRRKISSKDKEYVLKRDNYTCQICGISRQFFDDMCPGSGDYLLLEIDHVKSVYKGGYGSDVNNLQVLCWKCNRKKGGKKSNEDLSRTITYGIHYLHPKMKSLNSYKGSDYYE